MEFNLLLLSSWPLLGDGFAFENEPKFMNHPLDIKISCKLMTVDKYAFAIAVMTKLYVLCRAIYSSLIWGWEDKLICSVSAHLAICSVFDFKIAVILYSKLFLYWTFFFKFFIKYQLLSTLKIIHMCNPLQTQVRKTVSYISLWFLVPYSNFSPYKINNNKNISFFARISGGPSVSSLRERAP